MTPTEAGLIALQLASQPSAAGNPGQIGTNAEIEQAVRSMLAEAPQSKTAYITVAAHSGVVTLEGVVSDGLWLARFKNKVTSAFPSITIDDRLDWVVPDCSVGLA